MPDNQKHPTETSSDFSQAEKDTRKQMDLSELENVHPADAADHIENLPIEEQLEWASTADVEEVAETVEEMQELPRVTLIEQLEPEVAAKILSEMALDDAADALDELQPEQRDSLLKLVKPEEAARLRQLMLYDPDTAGGVMNSEGLVLDYRMSVDQAVNTIRKELSEKEFPYYAYLLDDEDRLVGVPSLRDILLGKPGTMLKDLIQNQTLITVLFDVDKEEVAHQMRHYNFMALPVVDYDGKFLGVVTHDDVMDIIHEEASEDMLGMVGAGRDETVDTPWRQSVYKRMPWLVVNLCNSTLAAYVVHHYEGTIEQMAILAALMPIVTNQGGNTGQQSLAVIIRQMAMEKFEGKRSLMAFVRELRLGVVNGVLVSLLGALAVLAVLHSFSLALVMGMSLALNMLLGAAAGAAIPMILKCLGRDPAQASSIFLTTLTDSVGFLIFLSLAEWWLL